MSASIVKNPLDNDYFMLVHFAMLQNIFCELMCPNCGCNIILYDENLKRRGYHTLLVSNVPIVTG